jgi:hypothetical protein
LKPLARRLAMLSISDAVILRARIVEEEEEDEVVDTKLSPD